MGGPEPQNEGKIGGYQPRLASKSCTKPSRRKRKKKQGVPLSFFFKLIEFAVRGVPEGTERHAQPLNPRQLPPSKN